MGLEGQLDDLSLLDLVQIMAYSERSGALLIEGVSEEAVPLQGAVIFDRGDIVVVNAPSTLGLLVKAAKEQTPSARVSLRRIHSLASLRELFDVQQGRYRFIESDEPAMGIDGVDLGAFYEQGALDTGDLLLVLAKTMDSEGPTPTPKPKPDAYSQQRRHERLGPVIIRATAQEKDEIISGYLTNLSLGGAFFHGERNIDIGAEVTLGFELPWGLGPCDARCTVTWARSEGPTRQQGSGLRFDDLDVQAEDKLTQYLQRFARMAQRVEA